MIHNFGGIIMHKNNENPETITKPTRNIHLENYQIAEQYLLNISLYDAVKNDHLYETVRLIKMNADVNAVVYGYRPLNAALRNDNYKISTLLLNCNADPNLEDYKGGNAFHSAVGSVQLLKLLHEPPCPQYHKPPDVHNTRKSLSVLCSAINRYYIDPDLSLDPIKYIITVMKADINTLAYDCNIIHFLAAEKHDKINILTKYIIDQGVDIAAKNTLSQTALHIAAARNNTAVISYLLEKNADVTAIDYNNNSPLELAIQNKATESINEIITFLAKSYQMMQSTLCHIIPDSICGLIFSFLIHKSPLINQNRDKINVKLTEKKESDQIPPATKTAKTKSTQEEGQSNENNETNIEKNDYNHDRENQEIHAYNTLVSQYITKYGIFIPTAENQLGAPTFSTNTYAETANEPDSTGNQPDPKAEKQIIGEDDNL